MTIKEFYRMKKRDIQSYIIDWIEKHPEYSFNIRIDDVKKPQKHIFLECRDIHTNNDKSIYFEIEIARDTYKEYIYQVSFNCVDNLDLFKRFKTFSINEMKEDVDNMLEKVFEYCLWGEVL